MKDIFDTFINTALWLLLWGMALYAILCFAAYSASADEVLTPDERIIAQTILGEARGEGKEGMYAVACVIKQRMNSKHWPSTAAKVCLEESQFDFWTQRDSVTWDDTNRATVRRLMKHDIETVRYAKMLAININKMNLNWSKYADHYCTLQTKNYWTQGNKPVLIIKNHKFYSLR
jgi:spore germination cell wall hydrolase CwlJ-like protein